MSWRILVLAATVLAALVGADLLARNRDDADRERITSLLTDFHAAASRADFDRYFNHFAPDAVFLGTDATERWTLEQFKVFAKPIFESGSGWTYTAIDGRRFITIGDEGRTAWFDELLGNAKYGTCRGSGVLRKIDGHWRIAQYNLAFMIPNDVAKEVVALIKAKAT
jgi:ketosteroid isomerase-like protein